MQESEMLLLDGVKNTVAKYGLSEFSTRKLTEVSGINSGLIYHYFAGKDELLQKAYCRENGRLYGAMLHYLDEVEGIPFGQKEKAKLWFHWFWRELLSDPNRLTFCTAFYHSAEFRSAEDFHREQVEELVKRLGGFFASADACKLCMYSLLTILYDSAKRVADGYAADTAQTEEGIFGLCYGLLETQMFPAAANT